MRELLRYMKTTFSEEFSSAFKRSVVDNSKNFLKDLDDVTVYNILDQSKE
jgi:hypothetical protein